jgi:outer membrane protein assembly factor BamB
MKTYLGAGLLVALTAAGAAAQERTKLYSQPLPPPRDALDRLNLQMAWRTYLPTAGRRDGLFTVQFDGGQMLVQTRNGLVAALDAETGRILWRTRVGTGYKATQPLAFNRRSVFVISSADLIALDRANGQTQWQYRLPAGLAAAPMADEEQLYLGASTGRLFTFYLPQPTTTVSPPGRGDSAEPERSAKPGATAYDPLPQEVRAEVRPILVSEVATNLRLELKPLLTRDFVLASSPTGHVKAYTKRIPTDSQAPLEIFRFQTDGPLASLGQFGDLALLGSTDGTVYALNMVTGRAEWRYTAGTAVTRSPRALDVEVAKGRIDHDVYVTSERNGLARIDRTTGEARWRIPRGRAILTALPEADRFLAANRKFVYALDRSGRLLVLDRGRGTLLSTYDTRDFVFPIANEVTDRLYLAANNGLIVCLHDREFTKPAQHRPEAPKGPGDHPKEDLKAKEDLLKRLEKPVTTKEGEPKPLDRLLSEMATEYGLKFAYAPDKTWKSLGLEPVRDKPVQLPKVDNRPLKEVLQLVLDQVKATYVVGDVILVAPRRAEK